MRRSKRLLPTTKHESVVLIFKLAKRKSFVTINTRISPILIDSPLSVNTLTTSPNALDPLKPIQILRYRYYIITRKAVANTITPALRRQFTTSNMDISLDLTTTLLFPLSATSIFSQITPNLTFRPRID